MISLLAKFPWYATEHFTLATRNQIFAATRSMLHILSINLRKGHHSSTGGFDDYSSASSFGSPIRRNSSRFRGSPQITEDLLKDLLSAALNAGGFSEKQRWELSEATDCARHDFRISPLSQWWPFEVLGRKPHMDEDVVEVSVCTPISWCSITDDQFANRLRDNSFMRTLSPTIQSLDRPRGRSVMFRILQRTLTWKPIPWTRLEIWSGSCSMPLSLAGSLAKWMTTCSTRLGDDCDDTTGGGRRGSGGH